MRRLIWGFAGSTYHIGGNLMLLLIYVLQYLKILLIIANSADLDEMPPKSVFFGGISSGPSLFAKVPH